MAAGYVMGMNEDKEEKGIINDWHRIDEYLDSAVEEGLIKRPCVDPKCRISRMIAGDPTAFLRMVSQYHCQSCSEKIGYGLRFCPNCKRWYQPKYVNYAVAMLPKHKEDKEGREQWISGICSDKCWKDYLGVK